MDKYIKRQCSRVKDESGDKMFMRIYFEPKYTKKGDLKDKIITFEDFFIIGFKTVKNFTSNRHNSLKFGVSSEFTGA